MWIYVFLGNVLRGIGETPVQPLGISYIDDYAQSENAAFYIGNSCPPQSDSLVPYMLCPVVRSEVLVNWVTNRMWRK